MAIRQHSRSKQEIIEDWATEEQLVVLTSWRADQVIEILEILESPAAAKRLVKEVQITNRMVRIITQTLKISIAALIGGAAIVTGGSVIFNSAAAIKAWVVAWWAG